MKLDNSTAPDAYNSSHGPLIAGWYGKIPCLGDFISRRLPPSFINAWDSWLQHSIVASRAQLGERWLNLYLTGPIWRFALMPGVCGTTSGIWAGILMPSVDKVGRYFPLTIALRIDPGPGRMPAVFSAQDWYAALERIALATLNIHALPDDLERSLAENPFPARETGDPPSAPAAQELAAWWQAGNTISRRLVLPAELSLANLFTAAAEDLLTSTASGKSFWWTASSEGRPTQLHCFAGLPPENHFATLLEAAFPDKDKADISS